MTLGDYSGNLVYLHQCFQIYRNSIIAYITISPNNPIPDH